MRIRSAEATRTSTCALADSIAQVVVDAYKASPQYQSGQVPPQVVLAGFVLIEDTDQGDKCRSEIDSCSSNSGSSAYWDALTDDNRATLTLLSWGAGTKFACDEAVANDTEGRVVRDSHAEVLARRGLLVFLWKELHAVLKGEKSVFTRRASSGWAGCAGTFQTPTYHLTSRHLTDSRAIDGTARLVLYTSSMPCGNASLKRWAKGRHERDRREELGPSQMPPEPHGRLDIMAREEGQVSVLVKGEYAPTAAAAATATAAVAAARTSSGFPSPPPSPPPSLSFSSSSPAAAVPPPIRSKGRSGTVAPGTTRPRDLPSAAAVGIRCAGTMSCSDKIARWNVLGVQGALLSRWLEPVFIAGIVVGRKFSFEHARRALCCRLAQFDPAASSRKRARRRENATARESRSCTTTAKAEGANDQPSSPASGFGEPPERRASFAHGASAPRPLSSPPGTYGAVRHPALMGTSVKLDEKVIITALRPNATARTTDAAALAPDSSSGPFVPTHAMVVSSSEALAPRTGADFGVGGARSPCLVWARLHPEDSEWWQRAGEPEGLDGRSGRLLRRHSAAAAVAAGADDRNLIAEDGATSSISRRRLFGHYLKALELDGSSVGSHNDQTYGEAKRTASEIYSRTRKALLESPDFGEWCVGDPALDKWTLWPSL